MREASTSLVPGERWGLRRTGPCHHRVLTGPPPPRLVGVNAGFCCAWATPPVPDDASICAAIGAVRPAPTIIRVKSRRETVPSFTRRIHCLSSRSSTDAPPIARASIAEGGGGTSSTGTPGITPQRGFGDGAWPRRDAQPSPDFDLGLAIPERQGREVRVPRADVGVLHLV